MTVCVEYPVVYQHMYMYIYQVVAGREVFDHSNQVERLRITGSIRLYL